MAGKKKSNTTVKQQTKTYSSLVVYGGIIIFIGTMMAAMFYGAHLGKNPPKVERAMEFSALLKEIHTYYDEKNIDQPSGVEVINEKFAHGFPGIGLTFRDVESVVSKGSALKEVYGKPLFASRWETPEGLITIFVYPLDKRQLPKTEVKEIKGHPFFLYKGKKSGYYSSKKATTNLVVTKTINDYFIVALGKTSLDKLAQSIIDLIKKPAV